ncbi:hypothetical protein [Micromonospora coerulea]|uniref:hypothetical protein n=1 Tax=Micromonospora coerulea TaxID=47856 RepID=UPI0031F9C045
MTDRTVLVSPTVASTHAPYAARGLAYAARGLAARYGSVPIQCSASGQTIAGPYRTSSSVGPAGQRAVRPAGGQGRSSGRATRTMSW